MGTDLYILAPENRLHNVKLYAQPMAELTVARQVLGIRIKQLRIAAEMTQAAAARVCGFSEAKLSNLENGKVVPSLFDVAGLCRVYGAPKDLEEELIRMSKRAKEPGWWEPYQTSMLKDFSTFLELERHCSSLYAYESELIHGLLQEPDYARAVHTADPLISEEETETAVRLRQARQRGFWERQPVPDVCIILHESALTRPVLSDMGGQWRKLISADSAPNVEVKVVPQSQGAHAAMKGPHQIMKSGVSELPSVVYLESVHGCQYADESGVLDTYMRVFEAARKTAVPVKEFFNDHAQMAPI